MVAFSFDNKQNGYGIIDSFLSKFTASPRFPNERHAISLAPSTFGQAMQFMGPFTSSKDRTSLKDRLNPYGTPKQDSLPINQADYASYQHDLAYDRAKKDYEANPTKENRTRQLNKVWNADEKFINQMNNDRDEPMAPIAGALISTKRDLERANLYLQRDLRGLE